MHRVAESVCAFHQTMPGGVRVLVAVLAGELWIKFRGKARKTPWTIDLDENLIRVSGAGGMASTCKRMAAATQRATELYGGKSLAREAWMGQYKVCAMVPVVGKIDARSA